MKALCLMGNGAGTYSQKLVWGYSTECLPDIDRLCTLSDIQKRAGIKDKHGVECLGKDQKKCLESELVRLSSKKECSPLFTSDSSNHLKWLYENQSCVIRTHYEKWCARVLCDLEIAIKVVQKTPCDVSLSPYLSEKVCDITVGDINVIYNSLCRLDINVVLIESGCSTAAEVFLVQNFCNTGVGWKVDETTCKIAHSVFLKECKCDISLKEFISATSKWNNCLI